MLMNYPLVFFSSVQLLFTNPNVHFPIAEQLNASSRGLTRLVCLMVYVVHRAMQRSLNHCFTTQLNPLNKRGRHKKRRKGSEEVVGKIK